MTSKSSTIAIVALGLLLAAASATSAYAWQKNFGGTRDQVRAACASAGGELVEGQGRTGCNNWSNGTSVSCSNSGQCTGQGPGPEPRLATFGDFFVHGADVQAPSVSLSSSTDDTSSADSPPDSSSSESSTSDSSSSDSPPADSGSFQVLAAPQESIQINGQIN